MYLYGKRFTSFGQIRHYSQNCMSAFFFVYGCVILWIKLLALRRSVCWLHCCIYLPLIKTAKLTYPVYCKHIELANKFSVTVKTCKQSVTRPKQVVCDIYGTSVKLCWGNIRLSFKIFIASTDFRFIFLCQTVLFLESIVKIIKYTERLCVK
jgi:hypothetical protein